MKPYVVVGLLVMFAGLAVILMIRPMPKVVGGPAVSVAMEHAKAPTGDLSAPAAPAHETVRPNLAAVDAAVGSSLDALKDTLFRLELRRQAGTISEEEYAKERARAEKVLRDLVRG